MRENIKISKIDNRKKQTITTDNKTFLLRRLQMFYIFQKNVSK